MSPRAILWLPALALGLFSLNSQAQSPIQARKTELAARPVAVVDPLRCGPDFNPVFSHLEAPAPGSGSYRAELLERKAARAARFRPDGIDRFEQREGLPAPELGANFVGNAYNFSVPNDNHIAVSNDGWVISAINSTLYILDTLGELHLDISLAAFSDTLGITGGKFDPKVFYDPLEDRFALVFLAGFTPATSFIIVCFSSSSNPLDPWHFYSLPGNPLDDNTWTDYPMVALTEDEIFITVNLLRDGEPWQTGFSQTLVWQMNKRDGYAGDSLRGGFWQDIGFGGRPLRNLRPVQGGSTLYGPDLWLLSNRNFAERNDSIFLVHISDNFSAPAAELSVRLLRADEPYGFPPIGRQASNHTFDTNDGRILGAFLEGGRIQFVSSAPDPATGRVGIYHGMIHEVQTATAVEARILGDRSPDSLDLGYPNIAFTGTDPSEIQSIIVFDYCSPTRDASFGAVYSNYFAYSPMISIKDGETYVNVMSGFYERWGDYTGVQRVYNRPGTVWASGNFGRIRPNLPPFGTDCRCNATWIGQLHATEQVTVGQPQSPSLSRGTSLRAWPNPVAAEFSAVFELEQPAQLHIAVADLQGRILHVLWNGPGQPGSNLFRMDTSPLPPGSYLLLVQQAGADAPPLHSLPFSVQR
jgi:hypothetical protein